VTGWWLHGVVGTREINDDATVSIDSVVARLSACTVERSTVTISVETGTSSTPDEHHRHRDLGEHEPSVWWRRVGRGRVGSVFIRLSSRRTARCRGRPETLWHDPAWRRQPRWVRERGSGVDAWAELYHGTSGDGAERICERGLLFVDLDSEVRLVSEQLGVDAEAVRALADRIGHTKVAHARTSSVSVAGQPIHTAMYAGVAGGEARRQFHQAAWLIMNDSNDQHAADVWSFEQTKADRMLVSIRLRADLVRDALGV
jgi:hypothetical protein